MPSSRKQSPRSKQRANDAGSTRTDESNIRDDLGQLGRVLRVSAAAMLPIVLLWSLLVPNDATSVFMGSSLPQVLLALFTGTLAAGSVALLKQAPRISAGDTAIALAILVWLLLTSYLAGHSTNPRTAWIGCWHAIALGATYYTARLVVYDTQSRAIVLSILAAGCIALSVHAIYQTTVDFPANRAAYEADPEGFLKKNNIDAPAGSPTRKRLEDRFLESKEPFATFALANSLAVLLSCGLVLLTGCLVSRDSDTTQWRIVALAVAIVLVLGAWFLTKSRTAYVGIFAGLAYWFLLAKTNNSSSQLISRLRIAMAVCAVAFIGAFVWFMKNDSLVLSETFYSLRFRLEYWYATAQMIFEYPLSGVGLGNFQDYYPAYKLEQASETIADPHNWFLDIAVCLSVPTAILITGWLARHVMPSADKTASPRKEQEPSPATALLRGVVAGGIALVGGLALFRQLDLTAFLISWPAGILGSWCIYPLSVRAAQQPKTLFRAGIVTAVVCLLASGSWQASGLAVPLVILLAGLAEADGQRDMSTPRRFLPIVASSVGLAIFCIQTWLPVTRVWNQRGSLPFARDTTEQLEIVESAITADPLDAELLGLKSQILASLASQGTASTFASRAEQAADQLDMWLAVDGVAHGNWMIAGSVLLDLAESARRFGGEDQPWVLSAQQRYAEASLRYPSDVGLHVQVAATALLRSDLETARQEIAEAWRLSEATPHDDKRLNMQEIYVPAGLLDRLSLSQLRPTPDGRVEAELAAEWIRNTLDKPE
ncbi:MAG: hypothetical protein Aurels2KO_15590 [Aureliella sp.]